MGKEAEIFKITREIQEKVKAKIDKNQKEYILREQMKVIRGWNWGESNTVSDAEEFEAQLKKLKADKGVKEKIHKEIERFKAAGNFSAESSMIRGYIETLLDMPWNKAGKDNGDIRQAEKVLQEDHYGCRGLKSVLLSIWQCVF